MGTIVARKRNDGSTGYMAQVRVKQKGKVVHAETRTFDRKQAANAWVARRETELREPGAIERLHVEDPPLAAVIDRYIDESRRDIGRTKAQVLRTIKAHDIAAMRCSEITSADIVSFARSLPVAPQTVQNYLSHLGAIFAVARPMWKYPLDQGEMKAAFVVAKQMGLIRKGAERERRPTLDELDKLMDHFGTVKARRPELDPDAAHHPVRDLLDASPRGNNAHPLGRFRRQSRHGQGYETSRRQGRQRYLVRPDARVRGLHRRDAKG